MADLNEATGKGYKLVTLADGKQYRLGMATVRDLQKLEQMLRDKGGNPDQAETLAFSFTWDGMSFLLAQGLKRQGYDLTDEQAADLIPAFDEASGEAILLALGVAKEGLKALHPPVESAESS